MVYLGKCVCTADSKLSEYSMPMLIPLMYFVTKGVQAFLKREKKLQKYEKLFCILVCVAAAALAAFTWARIIYPMYLQNYYGLR